MYKDQQIGVPSRGAWAVIVLAACGGEQHAPRAQTRETHPVQLHVLV